MVRAGEWDDNDNEELLPHQDREVIYLTVHPLYDAKASVKKRNHNIGLVLVDRPFTISRNVQTICLPAGDDTFEGKRCVVASWGRDVRGEWTAMVTVWYVSRNSWVCYRLSATNDI